MKLLRQLGAVLITLTMAATSYSQTSARKQSVSRSRAPQASKRLTPRQIASIIYPSMVSIFVSAQGTDVEYSGSGFTVASGLVATCFHVVNHTGHITVVAGDAEFSATVYRFDKSSDIALLSVPDLKQRPLKLSRRADHYVGDTVFTVGDPKGLRGTFSTGIVSNFLELENINYFQFTAPISPGSSGGPVVDEEGNVIGIVNMQLREGQNLNFATMSIYLQSLMIGERSAPSRQSSELQRLHDEYINATKDYKASLEKLLPLYEKGKKSAEQKLAQSRELFKQGLVSPGELSDSEHLVAEATARVNAVRKEMTGADVQVAQALIELGQEYKRAVARQPTCTSWTLSPSGQEKPSNSMFAFKIVCGK